MGGDIDPNEKLTDVKAFMVSRVRQYLCVNVSTCKRYESVDELT